MTLPTWPLTGYLTSFAAVETGSFTRTPTPDVRQSDYDVGPITALPRVKLLRHSFQFKQVMPQEDFDTFRNFWIIDLHNGVDKFTMPLWVGDAYQTCTVRAENPYQANDFGMDQVELALDLTVLAGLPVLSDAAIFFLNIYSLDNLTNWSASLHYDVHIWYPASFTDGSFWWMNEEYDPLFTSSFAMELYLLVQVGYPTCFPIPPYP